MAGEDSGASLYRAVVDRFLSLQESHTKMREQFDELVQEKKRGRSENALTAESDDVKSDSPQGEVPGHFAAGSPYRSVLESMGHAVYVCTASYGEIIYWNRAAETLLGWKASEVLRRSVAELLVPEELYTPLKKITERLTSGQSWSGQFPFKKRSGKSFMALVTKSPMYEDGELAGIITVLSEAAVFNSIDSKNLRTYEDRGRVRGLNLKRIQWHPPRPQIASVPQIASSVSNLASKFLPQRHRDENCNAGANSRDIDDSATDAEDFKSEKPSGLAAKVLAKLHIRGTSILWNEYDASVRQNGVNDVSVGAEVSSECKSPKGPKASTADNCTTDTKSKVKNLPKANSSAAKNNLYRRRVRNSVGQSPYVAPPRELCENIAPSTLQGSWPGSGYHLDPIEMEPEFMNSEPSEVENELPKQPDGKQSPSFGEGTGSQGSSSSRVDNESHSATDCEIRWEDLQLGEELGRGSYAVVYHGIWNGSDVAVKVYFGSHYSEGIWQDYKKEIDIMKKLRHPNVLLFMGAVYSQERLAIVTEYLPRGSLFKTLHKNNQALDIRRRLRMALDVARGMNYLHHRNPPILHRDLKSSNLLVDRNWNVKVGDFGLSRWKDATLLTTKSGRGTPQWMAPEVLRNEPSNEKSDVFSFGVILWELMTVSIPWYNLNSLQVVGVVGFMDRRLDLPEGLDPQVASIIRDCWQSDPEQRPSFEDIIRRMTGLVHKTAAASPRDAS